MLLPFLLRSKPPPSSLTLPTTQVDLKAFIYQQERTFTKPHQLPGNYLPQDLQAGPGTPDIGYQEGNPVTKSGKKKKRRKKGRQIEEEDVDQEYEAAYRAYLAQHNIV